jgi:ribosomal protein S17E
MDSLLAQIDKLSRTSCDKDIEDVIEYDFKQEAFVNYKNFIVQHLSDGSTFDKKMQEKIYEFCNTYKYLENDNPIKNWLRYRIVYTKIVKILNEQYGEKYHEKLTRKVFDCDSCDLTKNIFRKLHWSDNRIDTINSFSTVYKFLIKKEFGIIYNANSKDFLSLLNKFDDYAVVNKSHELQFFSKASHMLGNFMPCPQFFNNCKGNFKNGFDDRIDLILLWLIGSYTKNFQEDYDEYNKKVWKKILCR